MANPLRIILVWFPAKKEKIMLCEILFLTVHNIVLTPHNTECLYVGTLPGSANLMDISLKFRISSSWGAWITITVDPNMLSKHPIFPCRFNFSLRKYEDRMALQWKRSAVTTHIKESNHVYAVWYKLTNTVICWSPFTALFEVLLSNSWRVVH